MDIHDVIIVGGGPAGLSAALVLGRCRRRVLLLDDGDPRNARAQGVRGFLSRDGIPPLELLRLGREELDRYGVEVRHERAMSACSSEDGDGLLFDITVSGGDVLHARKLLLATGVRDQVPELEGMATWYGRGVYHCPYCDAFEHADGPMAVFGAGEGATAGALALLGWSSDVTLLTHGDPVGPDARDKLERNGIRIVDQRVARLEGDETDGGHLEAVVLEDGARLPMAALFFSTRRVQHSELPALLGCEVDEKGEVPTDRLQHTPVQGLFLAGDADGDVQFAIVAAAEGAKAAVAINQELQKESLG